MPQAAPKTGENSVGAALCGRPGWVGSYGRSSPPPRAATLGRPYIPPPYFQNRGGFGSRPARRAEFTQPGVSTPGRCRPFGALGRRGGGPVLGLTPQAG